MIVQTTPVTAALEALHASSPERQVEKDLRQERMVKITLAEDATREYIDLKWCSGKLNDFDVPTHTHKRLYRGQSYTTTIGKAEAYFGPFSVPFDMKVERDERVRREMVGRFTEGKTRALLLWGDYPRAKTLEPIGPHRFPHVLVDVIDTDGETSCYGQIDLHELYQIGKFDSQKFEDPAEIQAQQADEADHLHRKIAELEGALKVLLAQQSKAAK